MGWNVGTCTPKSDQKEDLEGSGDKYDFVFGYFD